MTESNSVTVTRFFTNRHDYTFSDAYVASVRPCPTCVTVEQHLAGLVRQMRNFANEPNAWSFARWRGQNNKTANLIESNAIVLEYPMTQAEALIAQVDALGHRALFITTENRGRTANTLSIVFPLTTPITVSQYARIASILAERIGLYGLADGCLAASHIIHAHASTTVERLDGDILDPAIFIERTKDQYQRLDAQKYQGRPPMRAATVHLQPPTLTADETGLFAWPSA